MGLNLGDITFGVEADTSGLQKSLSKLQRFSSEIDKVARSQQKGAQTTVAAMARQERAIKSAFQQTLNLRQALKKSGAPPQELARTTQAFKRLTTQMTKGKLSVLEFTRAQDRFRASTGKTNRSLKKLGSSAREGSRGTLKFTDIMRNLESSAVLAVGPLSGVGARIRAIGAIAGRSNIQMIAMFAGITALVVGFTKLSSAAINAARDMQKITTRLTVATGSTIAAKIEMDFITKTVKTLGLNLAVTAKQYALFAAATKGTNIEGRKTRDIFTAITATARALSLSTDDTAGVFKAITQIMSKGTVQAEELRGQMGERIPGAFRLASRAMGVTTQQMNKLLKNGEVLSDDFLPKFAAELQKAFGADAITAAGNLEASMERLTTATFLFSTALDKTVGISTKFQKVVDSTTEFIDLLTNNMDSAGKVAIALAAGLAAVSAPIILAGLGLLVASVKALAISVGAVNLALLVNPLILLGTFAVAAAGAFTLLSIAADDTSKSTQEFIDNNRRTIDGLKDLDIANNDSVNNLIRATGAKLLARRIDLQDAEANFQKAIRRQKKLNELGFQPFTIGAVDKAFDIFNKGVDGSAERVNSAAKQTAELKRQLDDLKMSLIDISNVQGDVFTEKQLTAIKKAERSIFETRREVMFLNAQIDRAHDQEGLIELKALQQQQVAIEKFTEALLKVGITGEKFKELKREFTALTSAANDAEREFKRVETRFKELDKVGTNALNNIETGIEGIIDGTESMGSVFSKVIDGMLKDLTRFFFTSAFSREGGGNFITDFFRAVIPSTVGGTTVSGGKGSSLGSTGIGNDLLARAHGGPVSRGKSFLVGERGPEIFSPTSGGRIMANNQLGGGGSNVNITVINSAKGTEATIRESTKGNTREVEIMIDDLVSEKLNNPASRTNKALRTTLSQGVIRR